MGIIYSIRRYIQLYAKGEGFQAFGLGGNIPPNWYSALVRYAGRLRIENIPKVIFHCFHPFELEFWFRAFDCLVTATADKTRTIVLKHNTDPTGNKTP